MAILSVTKCIDFRNDGIKCVPDCMCQLLRVMFVVQTVMGGRLVEYITDIDTFKQTLTDAGSKTVVVFFTATWCGPCRVYGPNYERLSSDTELQRLAIFLKVDVDEVEEMAEEYNISAIPYVLFFKNEEVMVRLGTAAAQLIKDTIQRLK